MKLIENRIQAGGCSNTGLLVSGKVYNFSRHLCKSLKFYLNTVTLPEMYDTNKDINIHIFEVVDFFYQRQNNYR